MISLSREEVMNMCVDYCNENNLSSEKLITFPFKQGNHSTLGLWAFYQKSDVIPDGLANDIATMPYFILWIDTRGEKVQIEQTKDTLRFIGK